MKRRANSGAAVVMALAVGSAAVLASCNLVVGVGDYSVGGADGAIETGGTNDGGGSDHTTIDAAGGDDQSSDRGGDRSIAQDSPADGGQNGQTDASGDRADAPVDSRSDAIVLDGADANGRDAGVDAGSDAGNADADGGSPGAEAGPTCGQGIPTGQTAFTNLVNTCLLAQSCDPYLFPISVSDCITRNALQATGYDACLSTITSCNGATNSYFACRGLRLALPSANECTGSQSSCVGNTAFDCSGVVPPGMSNGLVTDCTTRGGTCAAYTDSAGLSRADCVVASTCTVNGGAPQCANNALFTCEPNGVGTSMGVGYGRSCMASGTCSTTASTGSDCYPAGSTTCSAPGTATCSGGTLQLCSPAGELITYDCSRAGGSCATDTVGNAGCVSPGCSLGTPCAESCDLAHTITACVGGAPYPIDCTQYGFMGGCGTSSGQAYCLP